MKLDKKLLNLLFGAVLGQGSMLATSAVLLSTGNIYAGEISTGLGLCALILLVIDWGGQVVQRQITTQSTNKPNLIDMLFSRAPALLGCCIAIYALPVALLGGEETLQILRFSIAGFVLFAANTVGILDVKSKSSAHGLFSGLNYFLVAVYVVACLITKIEIKTWIIGAVNSTGLIIFSFGTLFFSLRHLNVRNISRKGILHQFKQGMLVMLTMLPGQLAARMVSVSLLNFDSKAAAQFNFLKSFSGILTQLITMYRRTKFSELFQLAQKRGRFFDIYRFQIKTVPLAAAALIIGLSVLGFTHQKFDLTFDLLLVLLLHSLVWLITSTYFNFYQVIGDNRTQPVHSVLTCLAIGIYIFTFGIHTAGAGLVLELSTSAVVFVIIGYLRERPHV